MTSEVSATVETFGSVTYSGDIHYTGDVQRVVKKRPTLTRMAVGSLAGPAGIIVAGLGAQKKKVQTFDTRQVHDTRAVHDDRRLYLLIQAPDLYSEVSCPVNTEAAVRAFAAKTNNAARQQPSFKQARPGLKERFSTELARVERDIAGITAARGEWERLQVEPQLRAPIERAEKNLQAVEAIKP